MFVNIVIKNGKIIKYLKNLKNIKIYIKVIILKWMKKNMIHCQMKKIQMN